MEWSYIQNKPDYKEHTVSKLPVVLPNISVSSNIVTKLVKITSQLQAEHYARHGFYK